MNGSIEEFDMVGHGERVSLVCVLKLVNRYRCVVCSKFFHCYAFDLCFSNSVHNQYCGRPTFLGGNDIYHV